jgi:V8-like Glu-specific endopeptidase
MNRLLSLPSLTLGLVLLLGLPTVALAQTAPLRSRVEAYAMDTGTHGNARGAAPQVAYTTTVEVPGAPWLRLLFGDVALGKGSYLTVTSRLDGAQQRLDAAALAVWQHTSAYFNGDAVEVALHVAPGDEGVFARMAEVVVGEHGAPESQCGPADDRTASTDARVGRLLSVGCTGWIISDGKLVSAGHCIQSGATTMQFNVPPSLSNGTLQHPGPEDQYSVDQSSRVFTNGGVGNDWGVFSVFNNTQTGLQPIAAQGDSFTLAQNLGPANIRITGYGTDSGSANQTQQTHVGPNAGSSGTTMRYRTDTTGGNSGSPVIDEATNTAVGVHTHGGCTTSGTGNNSGTSTFHVNFWAALGATPSFIEVTCTPPPFPIIIGPGGGSYAYEIAFTNAGTAPETFDGWVAITGPSARTLGPRTVTLAPGASITRTLTAVIPASFLPGFYTHTCHAGDFPSSTASNAFFFTKSATLTTRPGETISDAEAFSLEAPAAAATVAPAASLEGATPNPFSGTTTIRYALPEAQAVRLAVYDLLGREVAVLTDGYAEAGTHEATFDASALGAGVYVYRLDAGAYSETRRLTVMR